MVLVNMFAPTTIGGGYIWTIMLSVLKYREDNTLKFLYLTYLDIFVSSECWWILDVYLFTLLKGSKD